MDTVRIVSCFSMIAGGVFLLFSGMFWLSPGVLRMMLWPYYTGQMDKKHPKEYSRITARHIAVFSTGPVIGGLLGYIVGGGLGLFLLVMSIILAFVLMCVGMKKKDSSKDE